MAFCSEHVKSANCADLVSLFDALCFLQRQHFVVTGLCSNASSLEFFWHVSNWRWQCEIINQQVRANAFRQHLLASKKFWVSAEQNVNASTGHVCSNCDRTKSASLGNNQRFTCVLLCIQNLVFDSALRKLARQMLTLFNADCSDKNRLTLCVSSGNIFNNCAKFGIF